MDELNPLSQDFDTISADLLPQNEEVPVAATQPLDEDAPPVTVVGVQFKDNGKVYYFDPGALRVPDDTDVIIETARGAEFGRCVQGNHDVPAASVVQPLRPVVRIATDEDRAMLEEYRAKEPEALRICEEKVLRRGLDMKLVSAEYAFDGSKILFFFTSDGRVDFRDLVKDLAAVFRTRIELRQIGVRDEAKMLGGLGICGRPFCCNQFLDDFQPVSIKMAKTQSLSLNPTKISGTCGRLMCCLKYEQDAYESLQKESPRDDSLVDIADGRGTIEDIILLKRQAKVRLLDHPDTIKVVSWDDMVILRSGKAKKDDPDPASYPPSQLPQREKEPTPTEDAFQAWTDSMTQEHPAEPQEQPKSNRKKSHRPRSESQQPKTEAPAQAEQPAEGQAARKRNNYRGRNKSHNEAANAAPAPAKAPDAAPQSEKKSSGQKRNYRKPYHKNKNTGSKGDAS